MTLEQEFAADLNTMMDKSHALGGKPHAMRRKLHNAPGGAVSMAQKAMLQSTIHKGMVRMIKLGREDLTLEALVIKYAQKGLFSNQILQTAQWRLTQARI
ncbi:hypothetical protein [Stutzerimonas nitrititolerans]|uniref:hypothetical protein n=1 Tax=Stutzerimonas nitrititolerans TaxID=2482751 RepID=UPI0028AE6D7F|nr:hypothetical protein [Stutzerimonas nitrititolerans]